MPVPHLLAAPAATHLALTIGGYELGTGRTVPSVVAVTGLVSAVAGGLALAVGLLSALVGGLHAATAAGGLGTGNGLAGAVVALALGLVGAVLGGWALARSGRAAPASARREATPSPGS